MTEKILVTGGDGFIGGVIHSSLSYDGEVIFSGRRNNDKFFLDLEDINSIEKKLDDLSPQFIIHLAAIAHIDKCEQDRKYGKEGLVWKTNVLAVEKIVNFCKRSGCHLIYISTESVFDGKDGYYKENDSKNPISWYGITKSNAEDLVMQLKEKTILRAVIAYFENDSGFSIFGKIKKSLKKGEQISVVSDQLITPTYVFDLVRVLENIINNKTSGIFHITPKKYITPYQFSLKIADLYEYNIYNIKPITLKNHFGLKKASLRLKNATLSNIVTCEKLNMTFTEVDDFFNEMRLK